MKSEEFTEVKVQLQVDALFGLWMFLHRIKFIGDEKAIYYRNAEDAVMRIKAKYLNSDNLGR